MKIADSSSHNNANAMLAVGFVVVYDYKDNERWLQGFNYGMPFITNDFDFAKRFKSKKTAENALKKAIIQNNNWFDFGKIVPVG